MRREHLERLRPVCPTCRAAGREAPPLALGTVVRADGDDVLEGVLICPERLCRREHPIVDGIAVVVADLASWASHQLDGVLRRDDLSDFMESLLGDAAGPGSGLDRERTNLSAYGRSHWGDLDPAAPLARGAGFVSLVEAALDLLDSSKAELRHLSAETRRHREEQKHSVSLRLGGAASPGRQVAEVPRGPWVDLGCAVGRGAYELARHTGELAVGVDLNFSMLRVAERVRRHGRAVFPLRRVGLVYDRCDLAIPEVPREHLSFWCCDVGMLPFADGSFAGALSLNVLDCVPSPLGHLVELGRVLVPRAPALLSSPYDWAPTATPPGQWLGGHSQRAEAHGSSAVELRRLLAPDAPAGVDTGLVVVAERDRVPWRVYMHERATMDYAVHLLRLARKA